MAGIGLFLAAMIAQPSPANPPNASDQSTIIVTGRRNAKDEIRDFVGALTHVGIGGSLTRFEQSVCPIALGLPKQQGDGVARRMRRVAQAAGIPVGGSDCFPNVVVMVVRDKKAALEELRRRYPQYFGDLSQRQIRALVRQPGYAAAWQMQGAPVSARGMELFYDPVKGYYVNQTTESASRISVGGRRQYDGAVVVVERGALTGLTVTQLADYAAMRAFAGADPARLGTNRLSTILRILETPIGSEVPPTLTEWDMGFLRSYYSSPRNLQTGAQRSDMARRIEKEVERR